MRNGTTLSLTMAVAALTAISGPGEAQDHRAHAGHDPAPHHEAGEAEALARQIAAVRKATAKYQEIREAQRDGFRRFAGGEAPLVGEHWYRRDLVDAPLDLSRPSTLMYATLAGERRLIGVAYTVYQRPGDEVPEGFAGADDVWHVHDIPELARVLTEDRPVLRWLVGRRIDRGRVGPGDGRTQLVMVHAWLWLDNPDGMFGLHHRALPYLQAGLPAEWAAAPGGDEAAARGVALLDGGACTREVRVMDRIARLSFRQEDALRDACSSASERVRNARAAVAIASSAAATGFNTETGKAWRSFIAARDSVLTAEQRRRLESVVATHDH